MKSIRCILGMHSYRTHKKTRVTYRLGNSYAFTMSDLELCTRCGHKRSDVITSTFRHTDNLTHTLRARQRRVLTVWDWKLQTEATEQGRSMASTLSAAFHKKSTCFEPEQFPQARVAGAEPKHTRKEN